LAYQKGSSNAVKLDAQGSVSEQQLRPELRVQQEPLVLKRCTANNDVSLPLCRLKLDAQIRCQSRRYLPFAECCEWVRRNGWWRTQEEWQEWVSQGEELSPYIPTRPDEYYSRLGKWRGWSFFLLGIEDADDDPSWGPGFEGPIITR